MEDSRNLIVAISLHFRINFAELLYMLFTNMWLIMLLIETILCFNLACPDLLRIYFMCKHFILLVQAISMFKFDLEPF